MSDLYTKLMERIMPFLTANWQLFMIVVGALFLMGSVFRWKWVCDPQGDNTQSFRASIYRNFGEKAYRVVNGLIGAIIILCGVVLWVLM